MSIYARIKHFFAPLLPLMAILLINGTSLSAQSAGEKVKEDKQTTDYAFGLLEEVREAGKFISRLDSLYTIDLPVGIGARGDKNEEQYAIIISKLTVNQGQTYLDAYLAFTIPGTTKRVAFKGVDIPFSFNGGIFDEAKLYLVSDFDVPLSSNTQLILRGEGKSSVTIDCQGFKEMDITADVIFDSTMFVTENADGTIKNGVLTSSFQTTLTNWNDLLVGLSLEPFQLRALPGVGFNVNNAVIDLSDFKNPNGIQFSAAHNAGYFIEGNRDIWQGTFIQDVQVRLPAQFRKKTSSEMQADSIMASLDSTYVPTDSIMAGRPTFYSKNILIDELGFTGRLGASQLMTLGEGDMQGWDYSVENFLIDIQANQLIAGQFNGQILVPKFQINQIFDYNAVIGLNGTYSLTAGITEDIPLPIWAAELKLKPNSHITIGVEEHAFVPALHLNGEMTIKAPTDKADTSSPKLALASIPFEGMRIQTKTPYFSVEQMSFGTEQNRFSKFPAMIYKAGIVSDEFRTGLELGLSLNFTKPGDGGFKGAGEFTIWGKETHNKWAYNGVEVDRIEVDIRKGTNDEFRLYGQLMFIRGDETFGNGFRGDIGAKFGDFNLDVTALFGNVNHDRYWFADALFVKEGGLPAGPISLYSLSGGAYYHVAPQFSASSDVAEIGMSQSGITYLPDPTKGLMLRAATDFGLTGKPETMNGDAEFKMTFTLAGGLDQITFDGNAYFMPENFDVSKSKLVERSKFILENTNGQLNLPAEEGNDQLHGSIYMLYDYPNRTFHSNFDIYANVAGGAIKGIGPGNKMGWGVMHFAPSDWYVHLGSPDNPNGIKVMGLAELSNYFMVGNHIPELPLPPEEVMSSLRTTSKDYPRFGGHSNLADGSGFALGAKFHFDTGERNFLMFYGRFGCTIGFDVLLKHRPYTTCYGQPGYIGVNGWYAEGQAYAWVAASVGINVDLLFYQGKFSIFDLEAATLLQTKGPNPFWMKGDIAGDYNILNGLVKGHCKFGFEIGEQCQEQIVSPFEGAAIIGDISPADTESDVSVFTTPQVVFNMPVNEVIEITDEKNQKKYFRIKLANFSVSAAQGGNVQGQITWNETNDVLAFKPHEALPGEQQLKVFAEVDFEERINGVWYPVNGTTTENKKIAFTTGKQPPYIDPNNVKYSYPQVKSFNYYQSEADKNYIQLDFGQSYLFEASTEWNQKVKLTAADGSQTKYADFNYNSGSQRIDFQLPQDLNNNTIYHLDIMNVPAQQATSVDENVKQLTEKLELDEKDTESSMEITTKHAEGERTELQEKSIYRSSFRTSVANTLEDKVALLNKSEGISWELYPLVHSLTVNIYGERFDDYEVQNLKTGMAISIEPILEETDWYNNYMLPIVGLSNETMTIIGAEPFSVNPLTSYFFETSGTRRLTDDELSNGKSYSYEVSSGMKYYLAKYMAQYQSYLKTQASNAGKAAYGNTEVQKLLNSHFIPLQWGNYPVIIHYTLPGEDKPHKSFKYIIKYID